MHLTGILYYNLELRDKERATLVKILEVIENLDPIPPDLSPEELTFFENVLNSLRAPNS